MRKIAFVSDFDGTLSKVDFFQMVTEQLLTPADMQPWYDYVDGKITHLEALNGIFAKIRLTQAQMDTFISTIEIDPAFYDLIPLLKKHSVPVYLCSAGCGYYIEKRIGAYIKENDITLVANSGQYSPSTGLKLIPPPSDSPYYSQSVGVSKEALVLSLKKQGYFVVYAGDGRPDFKAARAADIVFARSMLLQLCKEHEVATLKFDSFKDIINYFKEFYASK